MNLSHYDQLTTVKIWQVLSVLQGNAIVHSLPATVPPGRHKILTESPEMKPYYRQTRSAVPKRKSYPERRCSLSPSGYASMLEIDNEGWVRVTPRKISPDVSDVYKKGMAHLCKL